MRNGTIDSVRLLAAAGIVLFHAGAPGAAIGYAGLPFFLILLVMMAWPRNASDLPDFPTFALRRTHRLLLPWLGWSAVYASVRLAEVVIAGAPLAAEFRPWMLLTGPSVHLWFLPFALMASLCLWPLMRWPPTRKIPVQHAIGAALAVISGFVTLWGPFAGLATPFAQWVFALPAVGLGLAFVLLPGAARWWFMAGFGLIAAATGWPGCSLQVVIAGLVVLSSLALPTRGGRMTQLAAELSLTVYLMHPLVMAVLARLGLGLRDGTLALVLATLVVTIGLSAALHGARHLRPDRAMPWMRGRAAIASNS